MINYNPYKLFYFHFQLFYISSSTMKQTVQLATLLILSCIVQFSKSADLVIRIPGDLSQQDGFYRLDYSPPVGFPAANTTFRPQAISDKMEFSRGLPGTKYDFRLYYSNSSIADWLTWTASITTAPDPPSNLSIDVNGGKGKVALLRYITYFIYFPMEFILVLQPFRSFKISSDTDTNVGF